MKNITPCQLCDSAMPRAPPIHYLYIDYHDVLDSGNDMILNYPVVDDKCWNGWHISEAKYRAERKRAECSFDCQPERDRKNAKRDPTLEIYLARFDYTPKNMPDRKQIEEAFMNATEPWRTDKHDQIAESQFTYEEYSDAFQYILDSIRNQCINDEADELERCEAPSDA